MLPHWKLTSRVSRYIPLWRKIRVIFFTQICDTSKNTSTLNKSIFQCIPKLACYEGPKDTSIINFFKVLIRGAKKSWKHVSFLTKYFMEVQIRRKRSLVVLISYVLGWNLPKKEVVMAILIETFPRLYKAMIK